ncbi:MAG: uroporphyrinogen decarboxylase [Chitinophagales bacterium]
MSSHRNDLLLRTLRREIVERPPVWMMRQAGRYLPDYRALREKYSFFERVQTPELATKITLQPVEQIGVDAAIIFSDILVVPQAMGLEVQLIEDKGPILPNPIRKIQDLRRIQIPEVGEKLSYVFKAIELTKKELNGSVPLIGFAGAPWTLFCYMIEGQGSKSFDLAKSFCFSQPELAQQILQMITDTTINYLEAQVHAGADLLQLFDSWAGLLSPDDFEKYSLPYCKQIITALKDQTLTILFARGAVGSIEALSRTGADALGIDWSIRPARARELAGPEMVLQGNFDPAKLLAPIPVIRKEANRMLDEFQNHRHIANLGHGILPSVQVDHAKAFVDAVKNYQFEKIIQ